MVLFFGVVFVVVVFVVVMVVAVLVVVVAVVVVVMVAVVVVVVVVVMVVVHQMYHQIRIYLDCAASMQLSHFTTICLVTVKQGKLRMEWRGVLNNFVWTS